MPKTMRLPDAEATVMITIDGGRDVLIELLNEEVDKPRAIYEVVAKVTGWCSCRVKKMWPQLVKRTDGDFVLAVGYYIISPEDVQYIVRAEDA